jgi:hypothetical protein
LLWFVPGFGEKVTSPLVENVTVSVVTLLLWASLTVAVAVDVDTWSAGIEVGLSATVTEADGPGCSVSMAVPDLPSARAVIVSVSAVADAVIVAEYVPSWLLVVDPTVESPLVVKTTVASFTARPPESVSVAFATEVSVVLAVTVDGVSVTATALVGPNWVSVLLFEFRAPSWAVIDSLPGVADGMIEAE